jgi:hypothetical protein
MAIPDQLCCTAYESDSDLDEILKQHETNIVALAQKKASRDVGDQEALHGEMDELSLGNQFENSIRS